MNMVVARTLKSNFAKRVSYIFFKQLSWKIFALNSGSSAFVLALLDLFCCKLTIASCLS